MLLNPIVQLSRSQTENQHFLFRLAITELRSCMTSQMETDAYECLCYVTENCLCSLEVLTKLASVPQCRLILEYTESVVQCSGEEWPPLPHKVNLKLIFQQIFSMKTFIKSTVFLRKYFIDLLRFATHQVRTALQSLVSKVLDSVKLF